MCRARLILALSCLAALGGWTWSAEQTRAETPAPSITYPADGDEVPAGGVTFRGSLGSGEAVTAIYAVDVSGSTSDDGWDCDGNGAVDVADDLNDDGNPGEVLDCEIAGAIALNTSLAAIPGSEGAVRVGLVPFGSRAVLADVGGNTGQQDFVSTTSDADGNNERDRAADIVQAIASMDQGSVSLFDEHSVGTGTDFNPALEVAMDALEGRAGRKVIFLLTDGFGTLSADTVERVRALGVELRPFAVTQASDACEEGAPLDRLGDASGFPCVYTEDPTRLTAAITGKPSSLDAIDVSVDGAAPIPAQVDPLGNWSASTFVTRGEHTAIATARFVDGTTRTSSARRFVASGPGLRYVALGDSYSAGEGIEPFFRVPGEGRGCHQSEKGYATLVGGADYRLPVDTSVALDYVACSGATLKELIAVRQRARGEDHIVQLDRVGPDADLVSLTIGGNDLGFSEIGKHCATQARCYNDGYARLTSGRSLTLEDFVYLRMTLLQPELRSLYRTLRDRTQDRAAVVAMNYPELIDDGIALRVGCVEAAALDRAERQFLNRIVREFRTVLSNSAADAGVWFADVIDEFRGHRVCDGGINTQSEWIVGIEVSKKGAGDATLHPDADGAKAYARVLTRFLRARADAGATKTAAGLPRNPGTGIRSARPRGSASARARIAAMPRLPQLTPQETEELKNLTVGSIDVTGLSALRGVRRCADRVAPGEHLVLTAGGFAPGAPLRIGVKVSAEPADRRVRTRVVADASGAASASMLVPRDLAAAARMPRRGPWTLLTVRLDGRGANGAPRQLMQTLEVDRPTGACTRAARRARDLGTVSGRAAPSAARTPGVPGVLIVARDVTRPSIQSVRVRGRRLSYRVNEPGRLTVSARSASGRRRVVARRSVTAGTGRLRLRLRPGRHRLRVSLTDAAGNTSRARTVRVRARR